MGSQIQKSQINMKAQLSRKIQRPQAKAEFIEVRVNDPGAPINSFFVESKNSLIENTMLNSHNQNQDYGNSQNLEPKKNLHNSNNDHIQSIKGILKNKSNMSQSSSRYFNEEAKFVRFQCRNTHFSQQRIRDVEKVKKPRKGRISPLL
ncbi:unnamed protein product (macronuclear) [Paramecium tetraurelia]|uniref:Uncharacterized protein n=1 Tax=Paramecium tetraurelia TaxID=5888 RepID=A0E7H7_PARTE|nr:uncharacterized protein GSPATT00023972001 [Paramecium tetraurelia]CAK91244.1 unnamed protein product [Paramecium tetraurelia]|eukprot:XP_001458641.1 hypothetical protein (macronuclear) [Paramecium tetraurelia strain d4-2]